MDWSNCFMFIEDMMMEHEKDDDNRCNFVNTIGIRCSNKRQPTMKCCSRHQCTFMLDKVNRCKNVTNCNYPDYCAKHGKQCTCEHREPDGTKCNRTIYFHFHKYGSIFCSMHQCSVNSCINEISDIEHRLCAPHHDMAQFCEYVSENGVKCNEILNYHITVDERRIGYHSDKEQRKYCGKHTCQIAKCTNCVRNNTTPWCTQHSRQCEFEYKGVQCSNFGMIRNKDTKDKCICPHHKCHWKGDLTDEQYGCNECAVHIDGCEIYCAKHYDMYIFRKFEYIL